MCLCVSLEIIIIIVIQSNAFVNLVWQSFSAVKDGNGTEQNPDCSSKIMEVWISDAYQSVSELSLDSSKDFLTFF